MHNLCIVFYMSTPMNHWVPAVDSFGVRLVLVRHEMGWNVKEAALACGIKPQSWRDWELSGRLPRDYEGVCKQIAARTKCDLIWLMTGTPSPTGWPGGGAVPPLPTGLELVARSRAQIRALPIAG